MKAQTTQFFTSLSKEVKQQLTNIVNETLAFDHNQKKAFSAADMWNIQRHSKSAMQRRSFRF